MNIKEIWRKVWWFIWEDNSVWSWIVNIIIAFLLIKFIVYPGLGLVLGTGFPVVAVVSSSMEHPGGFDSWLADQHCCTDKSCSERLSQAEILSQYGIAGEDFDDFAFKNGFNKGDIMVIVGPKKLKVGDVLVFRADHKLDPIIHRIVRVRQTASGKVYKTKGDNNCGSAPFEQALSEEKMIGKAVMRIPFLGWLKIGFVNLLQTIGLVRG